MAEQTGTDALQQSVVDSFLALCEAPDDPRLARRADEALHALDAELGDRPAPTGGA